MKLKLLVAFFLFFSFCGYSQVDLGPDIETCEGGFIILDATTTNATSYQWYQDGFVIIDETEATLSVTNTGTYDVQVFFSNGDMIMDAIFVNFIPSPVIQDLVDIVVCDNDFNGFEEFDLSVQDPWIIGNQTDVYVSYFDSQASAEGNFNQLVNPYTNVSNPQTIWVRLEHIVQGCFTIGNFELILDTSCEDIEVLCGPMPISVEYCYQNNDSKQYNFINSQGSPITLTFLSGQFEANADSIIVIDSDGVTELFNGNNNGDFEDLVIQSSANTISVFIETNGSISCADGSSEILAFDVTCTDFTGSISGRAFYDENNNDVFDGNDLNFRNGYFTYEMNNDGVVNEIVSSDGSYYIANPGAGNIFEITYNLYDGYNDCYTITTSTVSDISFTANESLQVDFPVTNDQMCEDLGVYLVAPFESPRPGFNFVNRLYIENLGYSSIPSGTIEFVADDTIDYDSVIYQTNPNHVITNTANGFTLDFTDLQPGDVEFVQLLLYCPVSVELGEVVTNSATYITSGNDDFEFNNTSEITQVVIGSYDPNDKMEAHGPEIVYEDFRFTDEFLYYTIRFQNVGTADAITVRIEDVLSADLDASTFQMLQSSHNYSLSKIDNDIVWQFDNIYLPAEQDDAEGSNGFVYFRIKPMSDYNLGDIIPNTASIFFDFNAPIITNTFETEFVEELLSISEFDINGFNMHPNPATDVLTIKLNTITNATLTIYDIHGKLVLEENISQKQYHELNVSGLQSGLYFVKLNTSNKEIVKKLIIE